MSQVYRTRPDYILLFVTLVLVSVGVLMVFSASPTWAMRTGDAFYYLKRHLLAMGVGLAALYLGFKIDLASLREYAPAILGVAAAFLLIVLVPSIGIGTNGANRWINLGVFSFQPGEFAKLALIIFMAQQLSQRGQNSVTISLLAAAGACLLVILQPDIGTAIVLGLIAFALFYLYGIRSAYLFSTVAAAAAALLLLSVTKAYRFRRLMAYLNPWADPRGTGFHIIQSLVAVGSGGLFGLGLGESRQKFFYLPQNYTDFIFAIFCEEMGLLGAIGVILLFFFFAGRAISVIRNAPDSFTLLLAAGITSWIVLQAFLNMSVVVGLLPTTGIPLPFISYGGTSLVTLLFSVGILLNISRYRRVAA